MAEIKKNFNHYKKTFKIIELSQDRQQVPHEFLVGDLGARGGVEDGFGDGGRGRGAVDVGPAGDARGEHALREEECEPEADRGGVLRAEQRLLGVVRQRRLHVPSDVARGSGGEVRNRGGIGGGGGEARRRERASRAVDSCDAAGSRIVGA